MQHELYDSFCLSVDSMKFLSALPFAPQLASVGRDLCDQLKTVKKYLMDKNKMDSDTLIFLGERADELLLLMRATSMRTPDVIEEKRIIFSNIANALAWKTNLLLSKMSAFDHLSEREEEELDRFEGAILKLSESLGIELPQRIYASALDRCYDMDWNAFISSVEEAGKRS